MDYRLRDGFEISTRRRLAAAWALLVACLCLVPSVALAKPSIELSPDKGPVGTSLTVSGDGFEAHSIVTVFWDDLVVTDLTTTGTGSFSVGIVVPSSGNGAHDVVVRSTAGTASARFVVQGSGTTSSTTTTEPTTTSSSTTSTSTTTTTTTTSPTTTTTTTTRPTTTTTTTTSPTTTTEPNSATTPDPTTTTPDPTTTTPDPTTTTPDQTTPGPTPTDPDPGDPTTSTRPGSDDRTDTPGSVLGPSVDTPPEYLDTATDPTEESTTTTAMSPVTSQMTLPYPSLRAWSAEDGPPELTGGKMAVGEFSLTPGAARPGATLELSLRFNRAIPGLTGVRVMMGGTPLGDQIPVDDSSIAVRRTVPDLSPARYEVTVLTGDQVLATAEFTVLEGSTSEPSSTPVVVLGVLVMVAGLGWQATRNFHGSRASSGALGPIDTWYAWRERRRR